MNTLVELSPAETTESKNLPKKFDQDNYIFDLTSSELQKKNKKLHFLLSKVDFVSKETYLISL